MSPPLTVVHDGPGWIAGEDRHVTCRCGPGGYLLDIGGVGSFSVEPDGSACGPSRTQASASELTVAHTTVGPPLVLALALQGAFCLHASAVAGPTGRVVAVAGASGSGKSTLARELAARGSGSWSRVADDALAVEVAGDRGDAVRCLPHFPQLKMGPGDQPWHHLPEALPLAAIVVLPGSEPDPECGVSTTRQSPREALVALLRHTMAARLFGPDLRRAHLQWCGAVSEAVPILSLSYPWRPEALPAISAELRRLS